MNKELAVNIAKASMSNAGYGWNMDIDKFDWVPGVGLYGIYKVYEATKVTKVSDVNRIMYVTFCPRENSGCNKVITAITNSGDYVSIDSEAT